MNPPCQASDVVRAASRFALPGEVVDVRRHGSGLIHDTWLVTCSAAGGVARFILQCMRIDVFPHPDRVMENIRRVTDHALAELKACGVADAHRRTLCCVPTHDGAWLADDGTGGCWRAYPFIERTHAVDMPESNAQVREAARAFAGFQKTAASLGGPRLHETIPDFHHTPRRIQALEDAASADRNGRAAQVRDELAFVRSHAVECTRIADLMARGIIPERVAHNDTKISNVLFDDATGEGICVVDLDTTMPGTVLSDFGDLVRSAAGGTAEDDPRPEANRLDLHRFTAITEGYLSAADFLEPSERDQLAFSAWLITMECGVRFLTDFLAGDTYFRSTRPGQNLDRCRSQFALAQSIADQLSELERIVARTADRQANG